ncbi:MAG: pyruvate, phosphate dikinase, partial [Spirochaetes bacterium]|nr:pyruvate, phosphate dikinase [Spirochaetota bacterium]
MKRVYFFGGNYTEGKADMKNLLGGKGANLAEMASLGIPVPPGFTITTEVCTEYYKIGSKLPDELREECLKAMKKIEEIVGTKYGDPDKPLLLSCRSGARGSMPGMMDTVLNIGLTSKTIPGMIKSTGNERFVWDSYRRLIMMYSDVVMEKAEGVAAADGKGIRKQLDDVLEEYKHARNMENDTELTTDDLKELSNEFKLRVKESLGKDFPDDPMEQLWGGVAAVFKSWNGKKAISYRRIEGIPDDWGTAVNVQAMVFGNMGDTSATGVAFTRNPATGENKFYGEWLVNAQGEDVVAGTRTPNPLDESTKNSQNETMPSLEQVMPAIYKQLNDIRTNLEKHYKDMLDIEFTIQDGALYMLQCRIGKRTGVAALNMAMDMLNEKMIDEKTAVLRVHPKQLDELLHPIIDPTEESKFTSILKGLPAGPGAASGHIVFTAEDAVAWKKQGEKVILVREETNPEDVEGMRASEGILTARGGMTSHAALVARGWGKCCVVGAGDMKVNAHAKEAKVGDILLKEGDVITLNGTRGSVYQGSLPMMESTEDPRFQRFMTMADKFRKIGVRTNADTPADAKIARDYGAEGIGLFRIEHMFYGEGSDAALFALRKMIFSTTKEERIKALNELFPFMKKDIKATLEAMEGCPVTIRLLDPPLHEFVPQGEDKMWEIAKALNISLEEATKRGQSLHESNPMMGHRGVRLGITYPEITEVQVRAIFESAAELLKDGRKVFPEIMVPVTCGFHETAITRLIVDDVYAQVLKATGLDKIEFKYGTMIEIPRAALRADEMAENAEFFSFGTNDLTQMTFGFSRDDVGSFMNEYIEQGILVDDPFQVLDRKGVGQLIKIAVEKGRQTRPDLKIGLCGEHGGDASSIEFLCEVGLNYVSCSPYRVPVARLAAAHANLK